MYPQAGLTPRLRITLTLPGHHPGQRHPFDFRPLGSRPAPFASYNAASARPSRLSQLSPADAQATPMEQVTRIGFPAALNVSCRMARCSRRIRSAACPVGIVDDKEHLLATITTGELTIEHTPLDDTPQRSENVVTTKMPKVVVDLFEMVDVEESYDQLSASITRLEGFQPTDARSHVGSIGPSIGHARLGDGSAAWHPRHVASAQPASHTSSGSGGASRRTAGPGWQQQTSTPPTIGATRGSRRSPPDIRGADIR